MNLLNEVYESNLESLTRKLKDNLQIPQDHNVGINYLVDNWGRYIKVYGFREEYEGLSTKEVSLYKIIRDSYWKYEEYNKVGLKYQEAYIAIALRYGVGIALRAKLGVRS